jgi:syndecan 4
MRENNKNRKLSQPKQDGLALWCLLIVFIDQHFFLLDIDSPKNLVADQVTENTVTVSWDPVEADIDRYVVRYNSVDGETREFLVGKDQSSTILTGMRPGVDYTIDLWAQKGTQESRKVNTKAPTGN